MRFYRATIRDVAARMQISQDRVRHVRETGVRGEIMVWDWLEGISGLTIKREILNMLTECV